MSIESNRQKSEGTKGLVMTSLMTAIIFIGAYLIKIPTFHGVMQFGDCLLFVSAVVLDKKKAFLAGGIAMAFFDVASGYAIWAPFSFIIQGLIGYTTSAIIHKGDSRLNKKINYIWAFIAGGIVDVVGYFIANAIMGGLILGVVSGFNASIAYAIAHFVGDLIPIVISIIIAVPLSVIVKKIIK